MNNQRKQMNKRIVELREDYQRARGRINFLLAVKDHGEELENLEAFVGYIDNLVECFPESQRNVLRLCVLDDLPVTNAAAEIGYHYTWVHQLRDRAVETLEEILDGDNIIQSKHGIEIKEKLDELYGKSHSS